VISAEHWAAGGWRRGRAAASTAGGHETELTAARNQWEADLLARVRHCGRAAGRLPQPDAGFSRRLRPHLVSAQCDPAAPRRRGARLRQMELHVGVQHHRLASRGGPRRDISARAAARYSDRGPPLDRACRAGRGGSHRIEDRRMAEAASIEGGGSHHAQSLQTRFSGTHRRRRQRFCFRLRRWPLPMNWSPLSATALARRIRDKKLSAVEGCARVHRPHRGGEPETERRGPDLLRARAAGSQRGRRCARERQPERTAARRPDDDQGFA